jgi:chromosome segregation ATPase
MELSQLEQMIRWLDEERKRDKALILTLQERVEQQMHTIEAQAVEIERVHQETVELRTDLRHTDDYPAMIEKVNRDLSGMLEEFKGLVRRERTESEKLRRGEIEVVNEQLTELDKKVRAVLRYEEPLKAREAGEQRLQGQIQVVSNAVADLTKRTEDRLQSIVYLEEQRRADTRRVAAVEGEIPGLRKSIDEITVKQVRLEDSIRKIPARVDEAVQIAKSYEPRIEELRIADFQREQRVKQYIEQAARVDIELGRLVEQTQKYALLYNQNKQALDGLDAFQVRLEKRQNEIAEMQRLTEERLRRQWEEWQATFARDWQKRLVSEEDRWRRQDLANQKSAERFADLNEQTELYYREIVALWEEMRAAVDRWGKAIQETLVPNQEMPVQRLKALRRFAEEKHKELL